MARLPSVSPTVHWWEPDIGSVFRNDRPQTPALVRSDLNEDGQNDVG